MPRRPCTSLTHVSRRPLLPLPLPLHRALPTVFASSPPPLPIGSLPAPSATQLHLLVPARRLAPSCAVMPITRLLRLTTLFSGPVAGYELAVRKCLLPRAHRTCPYAPCPRRSSRLVSFRQTPCIWVHLSCGGPLRHPLSCVFPGCSPRVVGSRTPPPLNALVSLVPALERAPDVYIIACAAGAR